MVCDDVHVSARRLLFVYVGEATMISCKMV
jgi:hypothetical protein